MALREETGDCGLLADAPPPTKTKEDMASRRGGSSSMALRWLGLVTAVWVQAISGNNYTFSNYSDALKSLMSLTQLQLNNLSVAKDLGKAFGLLAGLASDRLPTPVILLIGSLEGLLGYGVQWLVVSQRIPPLPYWQMCVFLCMGGNSTTWMNTAVLVTCIRNFRKDRGPVSGILKGYVGLSTAIFTDLSSSLFSSSSHSPSSFLLMLSLLPFAVCLFAILFLREVPPSPESPQLDNLEHRYFGVFNVVAVAVALYLLAYDLTSPHEPLFSRVYAMVLLLLLASPLAIPAHAFMKELLASRTFKLSLDIGKTTSPVREALLAEKEPPTAVDDRLHIVEAAGNMEGERRRPAMGEDHTVMEAMRTVDFWVLFISFLCGVGTGLAVMNNMGQMGSAMGYSDVSMFVSLLSIWGFFGRIASGTISEYFIKKYGTPRPLWNAGSQILMAVGYVIMAVALPGSLYIGSVIVGICYGVRLAITVPTASELFGLKYYGLIYNILILNLPLGSFLFSGLLAGLLYDREATETGGGGNTCLGSHCYRLVFVVMTFACVIGFGLDLVLAFRTRNVYYRINASKKFNNLDRING